AAIAAALRPLLADRDRLRVMSQAARRRFVAHPTWEQSLARIRAFLADNQPDSLGFSPQG
ncbi:MAG: hypothetical protein ABIQ99_00195, partial [Thermoflexales bacterium]